MQAMEDYGQIMRTKDAFIEKRGAFGGAVLNESSLEESKSSGGNFFSLAEPLHLSLAGLLLKIFLLLTGVLK